MLNAIMDAINNLEHRMDNIEKKVADIKEQQEQHKQRISVLEFDVNIKPVYRARNISDEDFLSGNCSFGG